MVVATYDLRDTSGVVEGTFERGVLATENDIIQQGIKRKVAGEIKVTGADVWPEYHRQFPVTHKSFTGYPVRNLNGLTTVICDYCRHFRQMASALFAIE